MMTETTPTLTPGQKAAITRKANRDAATNGVTFGRYTVKQIRFELADLPAEAHAGNLLNEPAAVKTLLREIYKSMEPDQEHTIVLCLNARNRLIAFREVYRGTIDRAIVEPRGFLVAALAVGACGIVISHNHPSGDPTPSREDREFTRRVATGCEAVGIRLLDHVVVGDGTGSAISFNESGLL